MDELNFSVPTRVTFGLDVLNRLGNEAAELGKRALLVTESVLFDERVAVTARDYLTRRGVEAVVFDEIGSSSTSSAVERAIALARASRVDLVIGLGGIRALSCAKCVARLAPTSLDLDTCLSDAAVPPRAASVPSLPYIEVPTTCRNPFMLTDECLIVDARNRRSIVLELGKRADCAIIDPALTLSLSEKFTISTMMDTLLSAIEAYFSRKSTFLSDTLSLRAVGAVTSIMDDIAQHTDDRNLRFQASQAGLLTAVGLTMSSQGIGTAVAYALGGKQIVPKSMISAVMIPYVLERGMLSQPKKVDRIGKVLGEEIYGKPLNEFSVQLVDAMRQRMSLLQIPTRLKDFGVALDDLVEISRIAYALPMAKTLAEAMSAEDIYALLKEAF
jgi:alcohol dehydrogenase